MTLEQVLGEAKTVGMAGHINPDGDCIGSCLGLYNYIKDNYSDISVEAFLEPIPNSYLFLAGSEELKRAGEDPRAFDLFIALDCGDERRLGPAAGYFKSAKRTFCIDHHISNDSFADENYIFPEASSTCELICELIDMDRVTEPIAACLYTGIVNDTGVFQYGCTTSKTMNIAGQLMDTGIDYPIIVERTYFAKTFNQNRVMGCALLKAKLYREGSIIASFITSKEMEEYNVLPKHMDGIAEQLRLTTGVGVSLFLYEREPGDFKVSSRATGDVDVNLAELAMRHDGGGHAKAAGFAVSGDPEKAIEGLVKEVSDMMDASGS